MKNLLIEWNRYLTEGLGGDAQIYCDMDGVLVDFVGGVLKYVNTRLQTEEGEHKYKAKLKDVLDDLGREHSINVVDIGFDKETKLKEARKYMYALVGDNRDFWANLDWTSDGKTLWNHIKQFNPIILTAPMSGEGSKQGKLDWVEKNLGLGNDRVIMTKDKFQHAAPDHLLIDDMLKYLSPWLEAGDKGIHHSSAATTIKQLEDTIDEETY